MLTSIALVDLPATGKWLRQVNSGKAMATLALQRELRSVTGIGLLRKRSMKPSLKEPISYVLWVMRIVEMCTCGFIIAGVIRHW